MNVGMVLAGAVLLAVFGALTPFGHRLGRFLNDKNKQFTDVTAPQLQRANLGGEWVLAVGFPVMAVIGLVLLVAGLAS